MPLHAKPEQGDPSGLKMFGYQIEPDFDISKEQRKDHFSLWFYGGLAVCMIGSVFLKQASSAFVFQAFVATSLFYGENFFIRKTAGIGKHWWHAILISIPLHASYLIALFWSDRVFPQLMTKAVVFFPVVALGFAVESILMNRIFNTLTLKATAATSSQSTQSESKTNG